MKKPAPGLCFSSHRLCSRFSERKHRGEVLFSELAEPPRRGRGRAHEIQERHHATFTDSLGAGTHSEKHRVQEALVTSSTYPA